MSEIYSKGLSGLILIAILLVAGIVPAQAQLQYMDGKSATLQENIGKGKWTLVMFWASDCHICNREASEYVDFHFVHFDDNATVLGISMDGQSKKAEAESFIRRHKVNFPNLIGEPKDIGKLFYELTGSQFVGTPSFVLFNTKGEIKAMQVGPLPTDLVEKFIKEQTVATAK
jgi:peroxiredoxin